MALAVDEIHAREIEKVESGEADMANPPPDLTPTIWRGKRKDPRTDPLFYTMFLLDRPDLFLPLIDPPKVFPKIYSLLGFNIYCFHTHLIVTPPANRSRSSKEAGQPMGDAWHQDSGRVNQDLES